ncbi:MAG: glycosyltransferase [Lentimicrobiaceae bacterium]|nr:glycosyltransferase [Lentimicrobiaceae bacterium]
MNVSIIIPIYNEQESLPELAAWIEKVMVANHLSYEMIMIDDGSKDKSWEIICTLLTQSYPVKGIRFRRNYGKAAALNKGFEVASGEVVITMDADLQDSPDEIPELFRMITDDNYDLVSGWKKRRHDPLSKRIPSKLYNRTVRCMTKIKLHDFNCGLKAYKNEVVKTIEVYGEMHRYIPVIAKWAGFTKIGEKVVSHQKRKFGVTKYGWRRFIHGFLDLLSIAFVSRFGKKPMHLFGSIGTLLFLIGFAIAAYLAYAKFFLAGYKMTERPLFYFGILAMILGTQVFVAGFLGELISRNAPDRNQYYVKETLGLENDF